MKRVMIVLAMAVLTACGTHRVTGYNLKGTVGQTDYDNGSRSLYTGGSVDIHVDVTPKR